MQQIAKFLALLLLLATSLLQGVPRTAAGTQCPTAPVQTVKVAVKDCCNHTVVKVVAPKPGSKYFVQCRCAEKKVAHEVATSGTRLELFVSASFVLAGPASIPRLFQRHQLTERTLRVASRPQLRPPTSV